VSSVYVVLHDNQLTHTDLKPENILFVSSDADLICDPQKVGTNAVVGDSLVYITKRHNIYLLEHFSESLSLVLPKTRNYLL